MDRLQAMHTFVRVVEAGSFSAVAREAATTQSAVSKQLAALERHLGARLLARTTRSLSLTEEGERYFEAARRLVAEVAEAEASVRRGRALLSGWLRVAASVGFGQRILMPVIKRFLAEHPAVKIDLKLTDGFSRPHRARHRRGRAHRRTGRLRLDCAARGHHRTRAVLRAVLTWPRARRSCAASRCRPTWHCTRASSTPNWPLATRGAFAHPMVRT